MFLTPEIHGKENYLFNVEIQDVEASKEMYLENCVDYNENFEELGKLIKPDYEPPSNEQEARKLYIEIIDCLKNVSPLDENWVIERLLSSLLVR